MNTTRVTRQSGPCSTLARDHSRSASCARSPLLAALTDQSSSTLNPAASYIRLTARSRIGIVSPLTWWNHTMPRDANALLHGTLDLLVLKAVAGEPMHGFGISKWIEQRTK